MKKVYLRTLLLLCIIATGKGSLYSETQGSTQVMTLEQKIGQLLMVGVPGTTLNPTMKKMISSYKCGGFIYFGYNCENAKQIRTLSSSLQNYSLQNGNIPLFISIDQEGGRVSRITDGVTQFPGNMAFGSADDEVLVKHAAHITGLQLRLLGINMNLAPDVDVNNNPDNPVINTRAFGSEPKHVARLGSAYIEGLQEGGCMAVSKHFPGHGDTHTDSHKALPLINYNRERLEQVELVPFRAAVKKGSAGIMSAHIRYPQVEPKPLPATLSYTFLTEILRTEMKYEGLVMTDDLEMGAIAGNMKIGEAAVRAFLAGADIILVTTHNNTAEIFNTLLAAVKEGRITEERLQSSVGRILRMKTAYRIYDPENEQSIPEFTLSEKDSRLLTVASKINKTASDLALYYSEGKDTPLLPSKGTQTLIVPASNRFVSVLRNKGVRYFSRGNFRQHISRDARQVYVYYECRDSDAPRISRLASALPQNCTLILVSTDNPFLLTRHAPDLPVLFTFSNTAVSYSSVLDALLGKLEVKRTIPIDLGFTRDE